MTADPPVEPSTRTRLPSESTDKTFAAALVVVAEAEVILANLIPDAEPLLPEKVEVAYAIKLTANILVEDAVPAYNIPDTVSLVVDALVAIKLEIVAAVALRLAIVAFVAMTLVLDDVPL